MKSSIKLFIITTLLTLFTPLSAAVNPPTVADGFTAEWIEGKILYEVILDTQDDDNDGSTTDWLIIAAKYENGVVLIDFSADGSYEITSGITYTIVNGELVQTEGGDIETETITAVDAVKITTNLSVSWGDPDEILYEFYTKADAESYELFLNLAGKQITMANGDVLSFYSNMTYTEVIPSLGNHTGTWSVENGILIIDVTFGVADKETVAVEFEHQPEVGVAVIANTTQTGSAEVHTTTIATIENVAADIVIPYTLTYADIAGKQLVIGGETLYFFKNMTSTQNITVDGSGVWTIENGVLISDITTFTGGIQGTETTAIVFDGAADVDGNVLFTAYETYSDGSHNDQIIVGAGTGVLSNITGTPGTDFHVAFDNDPVGYSTTVSELAGKVLVVSGGSQGLTPTIYFYENMTYKISGVSEGLDGLSETLTGTWSVENGVVIADVSMGSAESEQRVYLFDSAIGANIGFTNYLTLASDPVKEAGTITSISNITTVNPSIIVYLLN